MLHLLQETISWDLRTTCYGSFQPVVRIYVSYLLVISIFVLIRASGLCWRLGFTNLPALTFIASLERAFIASPTAEPIEISNGIPPRFPEHSLLKLFANPRDHEPISPAAITREVSQNLLPTLFDLKSSLTAFRRLITFTLLFSLFVTASELARIFRAISMEKTTGHSALTGGLAEALIQPALGAFVAGFIFLLFWYFETRLNRRIRLWQKFARQLNPSSPSSDFIVQPHQPA